MRSIVLFGIKHSGKSTLARRLSAHYRIPAYDTDDLISSQNPGYGSIREMYREHGLEWFSRQECIAVESLPGGFSIIATGGGSMENRELIELLDREDFISLYLDAPEDTLWERIRRGGIPPFLEGPDPDPRVNFRVLYERRRSAALRVADLTVTTENCGQDQVLTRVLTALAPYTE